MRTLLPMLAMALGFGLMGRGFAHMGEGGRHDPHPGSNILLRDGTSNLLLRNGVDATLLGYS